jgi:hypothetical protein
MFNGRIAGEFTRAEATEQRILASAMGQREEPVSESNIE